MARFTVTLVYRSDSLIPGERELTQVAKELIRKGARIMNVRSQSGRVGEPPVIVQRVTIIYDAPSQISLQ